MIGYDAGFIAETWALMDRAHEEALQQFAEAHGQKVASTLRGHSVDTADGIVRLAEDSGSDLVVLGSGYHGVIDRLLFGTTVESVIRKLSADLLLIKPADFGISSEELPKRARRMPVARRSASGMSP